MAGPMPGFREGWGSVLRELWRLSTLTVFFFLFREITKPLRPLGKAASLLLEILGLLCKSMVSESLWGTF